jgi:hypothetical protein
MLVVGELMFRARAAALALSVSIAVPGAAAGALLGEEQARETAQRFLRALAAGEAGALAPLLPSAGKVRVRLDCFGPEQGSLSAGQVQALFRDFLRSGAVERSEITRAEVSGDRFAIVRAAATVLDRDGARRRVDLHLAFQVEDGRLVLREIRETAP